MIVTSTALMKSRIGNAQRIVNDLMAGQLVPDKIYFFISEESHNIDEGIKPFEVPVINNPRVEFIYTPNIGSLRKIVPILKMYWNRKNTRIVLYDDDFGIPKDSFKNLVDYSQNINHRFHACAIAGNIYNSKEKEKRTHLTEQEKHLGRSIELAWVLKQPKQVDMLSSGLGLLIKPKFFPIDILQWENYNEEFGVNLTDELFISYLLAKKSIKRFVITNKTCPPMLPHKEELHRSKTCSHYKHKQSLAWNEKLKEWQK